MHLGSAPSCREGWSRTKAVLVPEWYFLWVYATLRSIPNKLQHETKPSVRDPGPPGPPELHFRGGVGLEGRVPHVVRRPRRHGGVKVVAGDPLRLLCRGVLHRNVIQSAVRMRVHGSVAASKWLPATRSASSAGVQGIVWHEMHGERVGTWHAA